MRDPREVVQRLGHAPRAPAGRRGRRRARPPRASRASRARARRAHEPLRAPPRRALARRPPHRPRRARRRRPGGSSRLRPRTGSPIVPGTVFPAPQTRTKRAQIGSPTSRSSSTSRTAASTRIAATPRPFACVASRSPTSATGAGSGIVSTSTSPGSASATAACTMRLSSWPQRTVRAGPATREPGRIWINGTSTTGARPAASWTVALPSCASSAKTSVTARSRPAESRAGTLRHTGSRSRPTSAARGCRAARRVACST